MAVDEKQIEGRLSLLYAISLFGQSASILQLKHLFQDGLGFSPNDWDYLYHDITQSDLVNQPGDDLVISDNGMVVLSFFQDRIPRETIERLDEITRQANALAAYEWQNWYDTRHEMYHVMQLKDHKRILSLQFHLTPEEASEFDDLELEPDETFLEQLKQLMLTKKET